MLGKKDVGRTPTKRNGFSVLGPDVTVTGDVEAESDLHIDGTVNGDVRCGMLIQTESSTITGAVNAESARLAGTIEGRVAVAELTIETSARIMGDITYTNVTVEAGAQVDGCLSRTTAIEARPAEPVLLVSAAE